MEVNRLQNCLINANIHNHKNEIKEKPKTKNSRVDGEREVGGERAGHGMVEQTRKGKS